MHHRPGLHPTHLRKAAGAFVVDRFFYGLARAGRLHPLARPERHHVEVLRDIPYLPSGQRDHLLDVWRPLDRPDTGSRGPLLPALLYVHGGAFRILSKDTHWVMALAFARRGFVVFNVSYRLAPRHPFPAAVQDTCEAYRWVVDNAHRFGADASQLVVAGESAGANLALGLTLCACYQRPEPFARRVFETGVVPRVTIPACGMLQVSDPGRFRRRKPHLSRLVEDRLVEVHEHYLGPCGPLPPEQLDLADPLHVLERGQPPDRPLPPMFAPVGTADPLLDDSRRLVRALQSLGVPAEASYYPGELHAFHALVFRPEARRCWQETFAFLERHLGRPLPPVGPPRKHWG